MFTARKKATDDTDDCGSRITNRVRDIRLIRGYDRSGGLTQAPYIRVHSCPFVVKHFRVCMKHARGKRALRIRS
jgi:hypothetical protein